MKRIILILLIGLLWGCSASVGDLKDELAIEDQSIVTDEEGDVLTVAEENIPFEVNEEVRILVEDQFGNLLGEYNQSSMDVFDIPSDLTIGLEVSAISLNNQIVSLPIVVSENSTIVIEVYSETLEFLLTNQGYHVTGISAPTSTILIPSTYQDRDVVSIRKEAFQSAPIDTVFIPESIQTIGIRAFSGSTVQAVYFAEESQLQTIDWDAFAMTSMLEHITLPEGLSHLGQGVFFYSNIRSVFLPSSLRTISRYLFTHSMLLERIDVHPDNPLYKSIDGALYSKSSNGLIYWPIKNQSRVVSIPDGIQRIQDYAFENNQKFLLELPPSLNQINSEAFFNASFETIRIQTLEQFDIIRRTTPLSVTTIVIPDFLWRDVEKEMMNQNISLVQASVFDDLERNEYNVHLLTNGWIVRSGVSTEPVPFQQWSEVSSHDQVSLYIHSDQTSNVSLIIPVTMNVNGILSVTINDETYERAIQAGSNNVQIDQVNFQNGNNVITIQFQSSNPAIRIRQLDYVSLVTTDVNDEFSFSPEGYRRMPASLNVWHTMPSNMDVEWIYSEILVEPGRDILYTYFMANGFAEGYFGMQVNHPNPNRRWILFSVWSPFETDFPDQIPPGFQVEVTNHARNVRINDFGNEGSGRQSYMEYPWVTDVAYGFLTRIRPVENNRTEYQSYFYDPTIDQWFYIATMERPFTSTYAKGFYSFIEVYLPFNSATERSAFYRNYWIKTKDGSWLPVTQSTLIPNRVDANGNTRHDYGSDLTDKGLELTTGGFKRNNDFTIQVHRWDVTDLPQHLIDLSKLPIH